MVDVDLSRLISGRLTTSSDYTSLEAIGVSLGDDGKLTFNRGDLQAAFADDPSAVEALFTDEQDGLVAQLTSVIDSLAGDEITQTAPGNTETS